jgi:thiol-disulfide isomerase/thioredoxin
MSNTFLFIVAVSISILVLGLLAFALYPTFIRLQPAYKDAQAICDSINVGTTYEEVKNKFGQLFFPEPMTYMDSKGNGQAQLRNNVKGLDTTCFITFENGKVISSGMAYVWL